MQGQVLEIFSNCNFPREYFSKLQSNKAKLKGTEKVQADPKSPIIWYWSSIPSILKLRVSEKGKCAPMEH